MNLKDKIKNIVENIDTLEFVAKPDSLQSVNNNINIKRKDKSLSTLNINVKKNGYAVGIDGKNKGNILTYLENNFELNNENTQNKRYKVSPKEIESVIKYYAGVKKENMQQEFAWVKWFGELATVTSHKNQNTLSALINQAIENKSQSIIKFKSYDPFSFFYFLAQKNTKNQKKLFFQSVDKVFNINAPLPDFDNDNCWLFPTPNPQSIVLYLSDKEKEYEPELLWDFFQQIMSIKNIDELAIKATDNKFSNDFKMVLNLRNVGVTRLTQTLFLINPNVFFTIDGILKSISRRLLDSPNIDADKNIKQLQKKIKTEGFSAYFEIMQKIYKLFPNKTPYEIHYDLSENGEDINDNIDVNIDDNIDDKTQKIIDLLRDKKQIILQGSPGTGKTYLAKQIAKHLALDNNKLIQFHPAYSYEDFVRGIVAKTNAGNISYEVENKILAEIAAQAQDDENNVYILIIDEINRANLSAVLGELIYALEYRGEAVESMYALDGERKITLPKNLYIIGTMNTADRSVGHIDYAIRRRFSFVNIPTDRAVIEEKNPNNIMLFDKINSLFDEYLSSEFDKDDVMIGHSYFLTKKIKQALEYEIKPILFEYLKDGILTCEKSNIENLDAN